MILKTKLKYVAVFLWASFTLALAIWWYLFTSQHLQELTLASTISSERLGKYESMLFWEGFTLLTCIAIGGLALAYYIFHEARQNSRIKEFLITFTHELKTPLASLRLQAESLQEDLKESPQRALVERLVSDTTRLSLQLENSLLLASDRELRLCPEDVRLSEIVASLRFLGLPLNIKLSEDCLLRADLRALETILKNLFHNAVVHGGATEITISLADGPRGLVRLEVSDNGRGFGGNSRKLGRLFERFVSSSGNGIGLYLSRRLAEAHGGGITFGASRADGPQAGFTAVLLLPGRMIRAEASA